MTVHSASHDEGTLADTAALEKVLDLTSKIMRRVALDQPTRPTLQLLVEAATEQFHGSTCALAIMGPSGPLSLIAASGNGVEALDRIDGYVMSTSPRRQLPSFEQVPFGGLPAESVSLRPGSEVWDQLGEPEPDFPFGSVWFMPLASEDRQLIGMLLIFWPDEQPLDDATPRLRLLADVAESALIRHQFQRRSLELAATERKRIAGDLHDDSIQALTAVSLQLQRLKSRLDVAADIGLATNLQNAANAAIERLRAMLFELHPVSLEDDGLLLTLEIFMEQTLDEAGVAWTIEGEEAGRAPDHIESVAFRLVRGAIHEALRWKDLTTVSVSLSFLHDQLDIGIRHDARLARDSDEHPPTSERPAWPDHDTSLALSAGGTLTRTREDSTGSLIAISLPTLFGR